MASSKSSAAPVRSNRACRAAAWVARLSAPWGWSLGVAASEHVRSVILFSNENPWRLDGRRVAVTRESSTSRRLAQLLAVAYWKADIEWIPEDELQGDPAEEVDGFLLIGDLALELMAD